MKDGGENGKEGGGRRKGEGMMLREVALRTQNVREKGSGGGAVTVHRRGEVGIH